MKTNHNFIGPLASTVKQQVWRKAHPFLGHRSRSSVVSLLLILWLSVSAQAQYTYTTNNNAITITRYSGAGGEVNIPSTINGLPVTIIGDGASSLCQSLTSVTIPSSVTNIEKYAFESCVHLTDIAISDSVASIGIGAFAYCPKLNGITVDANNSAYSSEDGILFTKNQTTLMQCPGSRTGSYTIPAGVTNIADEAFAGCARLTNVIIPASVISLGNEAFSYCTSLISIALPNSVTTIGRWAFYECTNLASITIPNGVVAIGQWTFGECANLASITLPDGLVGIEEYAFFGCASLTNITIPKYVSAIGGDKGVFVDCDRLEAITVDAKNPYYSSADGVLFNKRKTTLIQFPGGKAGSYNIPSTVTFILDHAFSDCHKLTSATIPKTVTSILDHAFDGSGLTSVTIDSKFIGKWMFNNCPKLAIVTLGKSITRIGDSAFYGCSNLTSITIPASVTTIDAYAFYDCTRLTSVYFLGNAPGLSRNGVFVYDNNAFAGTRATVYYLTETGGWNTTFGACRTIESPPLTIATTSLPEAPAKHSYSATLSILPHTGVAPYKWILFRSKLPAGVTLNTKTGIITGKPTKTGAFTFTVQVTDVDKRIGHQALTVHVN